MFSMMYGLKLKAERDIESITQHTSTRQQQAVEEISDQFAQRTKSIDKGGRGVTSEYHCSRLYDVQMARMFMKQKKIAQKLLRCISEKKENKYMMTVQNIIA